MSELLYNPDYEAIRDLVLKLSDTELMDLECFIRAEAEARKRAKLNELLRTGWWVEEYGTADAVLTIWDKCMILGIMHPEHNPHGQKRGLTVIKSLRARFQHLQEVSLTDCKDLVNAYEWEIESWKIRPPEVEGSQAVL